MMGSKEVGELEPGDVVMMPVTIQKQMVVISVEENADRLDMVGNRVLVLLPQDSDVQVVKFIGSRIRLETVEPERFCDRGMLGGTICKRPRDHEIHDKQRAQAAGWTYHPFTTIQEEDSP